MKIQNLEDLLSSIDNIGEVNDARNCFIFGGIQNVNAPNSIVGGGGTASINQILSQVQQENLLLLGKKIKLLTQIMFLFLVTEIMLMEMII